MSADGEIKREVRQFYDQVGWQLVGEDQYQNAHYEDLRPVSHAYIHNCHLRVARYLPSQGHYLLDAGSGPVQYPEYLEYSRGYAFRVCADISITALKEARRRLTEGAGAQPQHSPAANSAAPLCVVADVANLPFKPGAFDGVVSLHTIHHLPESEHLQAYGELYRVLAPGGSAAVVNGWPSSRLMNLFEPLIRLKRGLRRLGASLRGKQPKQLPRHVDRSDEDDSISSQGLPKGTFTNRHDVAWIKNEVGARMPVEIFVWRSVSVRWLRNFIRPGLGGRFVLRLLYALEQRFPHFFGENGQYPLIQIRKQAQ